MMRHIQRTLLVKNTVHSVREFVYSRSKINPYAKSTIAGIWRIGLASSAKIPSPVDVGAEKLSLITKLRLHEICLLTGLSYGSETMTELKADVNHLQARLRNKGKGKPYRIAVAYDEGLDQYIRA